MRRRIAAILATVAMLLTMTGAALADPPGPGDKQCVPGQQGNPHPGHKAGACPNQ